MSDMREALRKAGLVSDKQVRQAKHERRIHRKEVGDAGLEDEQRRKAAEFSAEREAKRKRDQELEQERSTKLQDEQGRVDPVRLIQAGLVPGAIGGPKQYYFTTPSGRITFLELSDTGFKRLLGGSAAIVDSLGAAKGDFCIVDAATASALEKVRPEAVRDWVRS